MRKDNLYGCIAGAAVGEAMGAAVTTWTTDMIREEYGSLIESLLPAPTSTKMKGKFPAGHSADAVPYALQLIARFLENNGAMSEYDAGEVLLQWGADPANLEFAGGITRESYCHLAGIDTGYRYPFLTYDHHKISNEAAARAFASAVFFPGDVEAAVEATMKVFKNIYGNMVSLSGAGAIAAAVSEALKDGATCHSVLAAGVHGARRGFEIADSYRIQPAATALVSRRMELAIEIGLAAQGDFEKALTEIEEKVGCSNAANESVPAVFGCLAACDADAAATLRMAVNLGNDTDMMGSMAGAIVGALHPEALKQDDVRLVEQVNGYDFNTLAENIEKVISAR